MVRPDLFLNPLVDLGEGDEALSGVYSPSYGESDVRRFMSDHYGSIESARHQARTIDMYGFFHERLPVALRRGGFAGSADHVLTVLEIGAGFGSATLPILDLFPNATVYATELSLAMLTVLKERLASTGAIGRCALMQLNAEELAFAPGSFDVVVGGALLHHLFDPGRTVARCADILKPGGIALFFEPFENGMSIVKLIYASALRSPRAWRLGKKTRNYMRNAVDYWQRMMNPDKDSAFEGMDDKWLFTRHYFREHSRDWGFDECLVYPVDPAERPFESLIRVHTTGNGIGPLPGWFWKIVDDFERSFSPGLKQDMLTEGIVVFRKGVPACR